MRVINERALAETRSPTRLWFWGSDASHSVVHLFASGQPVAPLVTTVGKRRCWKRLMRAKHGPSSGLIQRKISQPKQKTSPIWLPRHEDCSTSRFGKPDFWGVRHSRTPHRLYVLQKLHGTNTTSPPSLSQRSYHPGAKENSLI